MADRFDTDEVSRVGAAASATRDDLNARFRDLRREAASRMGTGAEAMSDRPGATSRDSTASILRDQAAQVADGAKDAAASIAEQARARVSEIVDRQKAVGADKIAGVAKAAHSAAGDLDATNPQMARLVRSAAESVDRIAEDVRSRDVASVLGTLAAFGRQQPVAFFGGAVLAGFVVSRFLKSDTTLVDAAPPRRDEGRV